MAAIHRIARRRWCIGGVPSLREWRERTIGAFVASAVAGGALLVSACSCSGTVSGSDAGSRDADSVHDAALQDAGPGQDGLAADAAPSSDGDDWPSTYSPPSESEVLGTLSSEHPRLLVLADDLARIQSYIASDPIAQGYYNALVDKGNALLTEPVSERVLEGPRLLAVSREVQDRVYTLALLFRLTGEVQYFERARDELVAVAGFSDWNPSHFLDVAEMTNAFAIGYDWLYHDLSASERSTIRAAIVNLGLQPARQIYETGTGAWWTQSDGNWNCVCNGGILMGALAVGDEEPALARYLAYRAVTNLPHCLASYAGRCPQEPPRTTPRPQTPRTGSPLSRLAFRGPSCCGVSSRSTSFVATGVALP